MNKKIRLIIYILISGFFLLLDQILKYIAKSNSDFTYYIYKPYLGWEYLINNGIAFSLPLPNFIIIFLTSIIILSIILFSLKKKDKTNLFIFSIFLILAGAISNFIDRILFLGTIDYLRIFTGVINLADIMIVFGVFLLIWSYKK